MTAKTASKPPKPYVTYPLFAHASGRWAKKVRGRFVYFGKWSDDPKGERALAQFLDEVDTLHAGRRPRRKGEHGPDVATVCSDFLDAKELRVNGGELTLRSFMEYKATTDRLVEHFGRRCLVSDITPGDFERLRAKIAERYGPARLGNEIGRVRSVFKHALDSQLIDRPAAFGQSFRKPSQRTMRIARATAGPRLFSAKELRVIFKAADMQLSATILLGVNCGFGQSDIAHLPLSAIDLKCGWIDFPRPKTGTSRRCPLWPETVAAVREAIAQRPKPRTKATEMLALLAPDGRLWVETAKTGANIDRLGKSFARLLEALKFKRPGVSFYSLRRTFQTQGDECRDPVAVSAIMGHVASSTDMASLYRQRISDDRLRVVTEHVRGWVFGTKGKR